MSKHTQDMMIYQDGDGNRVIASDDKRGHSAASDGLGKTDIDMVEATGLAVNVASLSDDQRHHLKRHGWCVAD